MDIAQKPIPEKEIHSVVVECKVWIQPCEYLITLSVDLKIFSSGIHEFQSQHGNGC